MNPQPYVSRLKCMDPVRAAEREQWDIVFGALGIRLTLKETKSDQTDSGPGSQSQAYTKQVSARQRTTDTHVTKLLDAVQKDFWQTAIPLENCFADCLASVDSRDLITGGVFPSVNISEGVTTGTHLQRPLEREILKHALRKDHWKTITLILFLLTPCGEDTEEREIAIRRAVQCKDWRYFTAVAGQALKLFHSKPRFLLDILGLCPDTVLLDRTSRIDAIARLVGCDIRNNSLIGLIIKTVISWAKNVRGHKLVRKWIIPLEIMEDFSYCTRVLENYFVLSLKQEKDKRVDCCFELCEYAITNRILFPIKESTLQTYLTRGQIDRAARVSVEMSEWDFFMVCVKAGADITQFLKGSTVLQIALWVGPFLLKPEHVPATGVNNRNSQGLTLLHTAVSYWSNERSVHAINNITVLCEHGADFRIPYPSGELVMENILNHSKREEKRTEINELILVFVKFAAVRGIQVNWEVASGVGKNLLHVMCENGANVLLHKLIGSGLDPLCHRNHHTLIDTAVFAKGLSASDRLQVLRALCVYPAIIENHRSTISFRMHSNVIQSFIPLHKLILNLIDGDDDYFEIIRFLVIHNVFCEAEYKDALATDNVQFLKMKGMQNVIDLLESKVGINAQYA